MRVQLGQNLNFMVRTKDGSRTPAAPGAAPTITAYHGDTDNAMVNGTGSMTLVGGTTTLYRYSLPCTQGNGYASGQSYSVIVDYTTGGTARAEEIVFYVD